MTSDNALRLAQAHWNETPLYYSAAERYRIYPWLPKAAEFDRHSGENVLEVACGTGCDLLQFAVHGATATGVDITDAHVALARERVTGRAKVIQSDIHNLPFPDESFDYVYSHGVLHHCDDPRRIVEEIFRVLKSTGRFNIHVYALWSYTAFYNWRTYGKEWKRKVENSEAPVKLDLYTARSIRRLFRPATVEIKKHELTSRTLGFLEPWLGWYLVAKGAKPSNWTSSKPEAGDE